jgi:superfamily II DNA/RNA helicase
VGAYYRPALVEGEQQKVLEDDGQTMAEDNGRMEDITGGFSRIPGLDPFFAGRLAERNILDPTGIQRQVIPLLLAGQSVIFRSATGTGKTFAYLLPLFQRLLGLPAEEAGASGAVDGADGERRPGGPAGGPGAVPAAAHDNGGGSGGPADNFGGGAGGLGGGHGAAAKGPHRGPDGPAMLILAPTHELCAQIKAEVDFLLKGNFVAPGRSAVWAGKADRVGKADLRSLLVIGQTGMSRQIESLKKEKPAIVVGNPSRILALAKMGKLRFGGLRFLVLDEGDRLVSDDMYETAAELAALIHRRRPVPSELCAVACSATLSPESRGRLLPLLGKGQEEVTVVETDEAEILRERIGHWAFFSEGRQKLQTLRSLLAALKPKKALVIAGRGGEPGKAVAQLQHHHIHAAPLFGDMDGKSRKDAIDGFRSGRIPVLVSSDLAARGLDIPGITHVIALDVPEKEGGYIHRAGRTARAGKRGIMITIGDAGEMRRLVRLEKKLGITIYPKELRGGKVCAVDAAEDGGP